MNELKVFNNDNLGQVRVIKQNGEPWFVQIMDEKYSKYELLALASSIADRNINTAWEVMNLASTIFHPCSDWIFNELYSSTALNITWIEGITSTEFAIHEYFKNNYKRILSEQYELINKKNIKGGIPDVWLKIGDKEIPVEIKKNTFDNAALKQLRRYMCIYNCNEGIAIAKKLTVELPENIAFISCDGWV